MTSVQFTGGYTDEPTTTRSTGSLSSGFALLASMLTWMVVLPQQGMDMQQMENGSYMGQFMATHSSLFTIASLFDWLLAGSTFVLATILAHRFSKSQPWSASVIRGTGYLATAGFALAGMIGVMTAQMGAHEYAANPATGVQLAQFTGAVQWSVESAGWGFSGFVILYSALASRKTNAFAGWVNTLGIISGSLYLVGTVLLAISTSLMMVGMFGGLIAIAYNIGLARYFMRADQNEFNLAPQGS